MKLLLFVFLFSLKLFALNIDKTWYEESNENLEKIYLEQLKKN